MSYCVAWKREGVAYLFADTAVSGHIKHQNAEKNSFGQLQTEYDGYIVEENLLKIVQIKDNIALAYATDDLNNALEMIEMIKRNIEYMPIYDVIGLLEATYDDKCSTELIIVFSDEDGTAIYKFIKGKAFKCEFAEIGSGRNIPKLSKDIKAMKDGYVSDKPDSYLAKLMMILECYFYHCNTFPKGVGGTVTGLYINSKIHYPRDIVCYIYENDLYTPTTTISTICRNGMYFSSSEVGSIRGFVFDANVLDEKTLRKAVKAVDTKAPFYVGIYSNKNNSIIFVDAKGNAHTLYFSRYIKRGYKKTDYLYALNDMVIDLLNNKLKNNQRIPLANRLVQHMKYNHHEFLMELKTSDKEQFDKLISYDFDFEIMEPSIDKSLIREVKKDIGNYSNIIVVDYDYLIKKIRDNYNLWKQTKAFEGTFDYVNCYELFHYDRNTFDFDQQCIVLITNQDEHVIEDADFDMMLHYFSNIFTIQTDKHFSVLCYALLKQFYVNDDFFALNKFYIVADDEETNNILFDTAPKCNFEFNGIERPKGDIILIRNNNDETSMFTTFLHGLIDEHILKFFYPNGVKKRGEMEYEIFEILQKKKDLEKDIS